jgi:hypothetical protein
MIAMKRIWNARTSNAWKNQGPALTRALPTTIVFFPNAWIINALRLPSPWNRAIFPVQPIGIAIGTWLVIPKMFACRFLVHPNKENGYVKTHGIARTTWNAVMTLALKQMGMVQTNAKAIRIVSTPFAKEQPVFPFRAREKTNALLMLIARG